MEKRKVLRRLRRTKDGAVTTPGITNTRKDGGSSPSSSSSSGIMFAKGRGQHAKDTIEESDAGVSGNSLLETAALPANSSAALLGPRNYYSSIVDDFFDPELYNIGSKDSRNSGNKTSINTIYRDMYYHDPICGPAVDIMSQMPFSEFVITGAKEEKTLIPFKESMANLKMDMFLPSLSVDYLVHGMFCGTTLFDNDKNHYKGIIPQHADHVSLQTVPIFGRDPMVSLNIGNALQELLSSDDPRAKVYLDQLPDEYKDKDKISDSFKPDPKDVIYIPKRAMMRDARGVSIYRRLLLFWLMEKALIRGTLDQTFKRQRSVSHMTVGDDEWSPTGDEMSSLADMLLNADLDPVGAVFVTRQGVNVSDIRAGGDFWKSSDMADYFIQHKYKALGISEAFLDGTASYNAMEQVMTTFIEQQKDYRRMITMELFYDKTFPRISRENNFKSNLVGIETASSGDGTTDLLRAQMELAKTGGRYSNSDQMENDIFLPKVHWLKRLRPEADEAYVNMLDILAQKGIPIPIRAWASAGGLDVNEMMDGLDDDIKLWEKISSYNEEVKEFKGGGGDEEGGGFLGASAKGAIEDLAIAQINRRKLQRVGLGNRNHDPDYALSEIANFGGGGRRIPSTKKGRRLKEEQMHKNIAAAAVSTAEIENRKARAEEKDLVEGLPVRHYSSSSKPSSGKLKK